MAESLQRPKLVKGALASFGSQLVPGVPRVVVFQYNPGTLSRTLRRRTASGQGPAEEDRAAKAAGNLDLRGPPAEEISLTAELDAADQLETPQEHPAVALAGLHPALATLELLLYPPSELVLRNRVAAAAGSRAVTTADAPISLLVWGPSRVVPVEVQGYEITEQAFDQRLNPIRAEVDMDLRVLTSRELQAGTLGHDAAFAHHVAKEALAALQQADAERTAVGQVGF